MSNNPVGLGLCSALFIVFLVLKLAGLIAWSWWWVTSPLWIPVAIFLLICVFLVLLVKSDKANTEKNNRFK